LDLRQDLVVQQGSRESERIIALSVSDTWTELVEEIVCAALELTAPDERAAYLDAVCGANSRLRAAVNSMLEAQPAVELFFRESIPALPVRLNVVARESAPSNPPAGADDAEALCCGCEDGDRFIGPYRLLQKIGEGGCGSVYLAEQQAPVRRRVALKIIKLGMDTKRVILRFEAERQALALMDHPNIARVLDAGSTAGGRPYFVMELVQGIRITRYCDEHRLDMRERIRLFIEVCNAVQHAHQKGIIHRDIKPSNVLITSRDGVPMPKVIDFGIAKATRGQALTEETVLTDLELFVGTPAYMSPEQAGMGRLDIDTRSDVYSLGALLYELLTGRPPFDHQELVRSGIDEMRRTLCDREPLRPSAQLDALRRDELTEIALRRRVEPGRLKSLLAGDLDWIVMKALEKDRARRYQTANALGMELQRYLNREPVLARPPTRWYRFSKTVQRNKGVFAATGAVSLALTAGFGASSWLFIREREARHQQALLRQEAEAARGREEQLRLEAEDRARIARAANLVTLGRLRDADNVMSLVQTPVTRPSMDAAHAFSRLGDWHAIHGRWQQAADCFVKLRLANPIDDSDLTDNASRDLLRVAPTLVIAGDLAGYRRLIRETAARFSRSTHPVAAEQILKISTFVPPEPDILDALQPLASVAENSMRDGLQPPQPAFDPACVVDFDAWRALALAMYHYRCGNFAASARWGRQSLSAEDRTPTRRAMAYAIVAMASCRIDAAEGRAELASAEALVNAAFAGNPYIPATGNDQSGYWNDWLMARFLCEEARSILGGRTE